MSVARRILAGLDTGVIGSFAVILWFLVSTLAKGDVWYSKFNVVAGLFFNNRVFQSGASLVTFVGLSFVVVLYSLAAVPAAWILPARSGYLLRFASALLYAAALHFALARWLWPSLPAFSGSYFPVAATLPAHFFYAICLLRLPSRLHALHDLEPSHVISGPSGSAW